MPIIKRYPNRKLYNTSSNRYITLGDIADLIRQGEDVQVIDHRSGDDVTALTLAQIIADQEKRPGGHLPASLLADLLRAGDKGLQQLRQAMPSPMRFLRELDSEASGGSRSEHTRLSHFLPLTAVEVLAALQRYGVPSREELQRLHRQLDALAAALNELSGFEGEERSE